MFLTQKNGSSMSLTQKLFSYPENRLEDISDSEKSLEGVPDSVIRLECVSDSENSLECVLGWANRLEYVYDSENSLE